MEIKALEIFLEVARSGGFANAARVLDLDPSSVSRTISSLEDEIGVRLFQRTTRSLSLTEAGARYLQRVEPLTHELNAARDAVLEDVGSPSGTLRLTSAISFAEQCLLPYLPTFQKQYPELKLELILRDENLDLVENRIDLGIRLASEITGDLIVSKLRETRYHVCASPRYLQQHGLPKTPLELKEHECVVFDLPAYRSTWWFRKGLDEIQEVPIKPGIVISNAMVLKRATLQGMGPALLADWLVRDELESGELVDLFPSFQATATSFETAVWFVYPSGVYVPHKVRVAIDFFRDMLA